MANEIDKLYKLISEAFSIELELDGGDSVCLRKDQTKLILEALHRLKDEAKETKSIKVGDKVTFEAKGRVEEIEKDDAYIRSGFDLYQRKLSHIRK